MLRRASMRGPWLRQCLQLWQPHMQAPSGCSRAPSRPCSPCLWSGPSRWDGPHLGGRGVAICCLSHSSEVQLRSPTLSAEPSLGLGVRLPQPACKHQVGRGAALCKAEAFDEELTLNHAHGSHAERHAPALQETEACSALVTRHAVNPLLADGWVGEACSCCCMALLHAHALAATLKLVLAPRLQARLGKALHQVSPCLKAW